MAIDIRKPLKKILPHLLKAKQENLNEADTCTRICEVFEQVLGYDPLEHISREVQIKEGFADFGIKIDSAVKFLVEAKAAGMDLRERHIGQAERYAAQGNIPWVLLTNGTAWHLYHLSFGEGIDYERAFSVDLASDDFDKAAETLSVLHRRSIQKGDLEEFWQHKSALSPESIAKALFTEEALRLMRRDIRKREGILIDEEDLGRALHDMLSVEARERVGPLKIRRKRKARAKEAEAPEAASSQPPPAQTTSPDAAKVPQPTPGPDPSAGQPTPSKSSA